MTGKDDDFLKKLRATFKVEAAEHLQAITNGLLELEKTPTPEAQQKIVEIVFRAAHSLKGAARAVDFTEIEALCQSLEEVFAAWKRQDSAPSPSMLDTLHHVLDAITSILVGSPDSTVSFDTWSLRQSLSQIETAVPAPPAAILPVIEPVEAARPRAAYTSKAEKAVPEETVRVAIAKLDARLLVSEEMLTAKLTAGQHVSDLRDLVQRFEVWRNEWAAVEPYIRELRQSRSRAPGQKERRSSADLTRLLDFFDWSLDYLKSLENRTALLGRTAGQDHHIVGKLVDDLLEDSKNLLLLPFTTISASLPKLVRDLCRDQGKEADFTIHGDNIEIDKRILEEMKDPLVHLLRNSIDHGIEFPEERIRLGKPPRATIILEASRVNGNKVQLQLSDDGTGIDIHKVKQSAIKHGLLLAEEAEQLTEGEAQALIFQSAISTSPIVTELSGRGLGLAIVREKSEKLGGEVSVESHPGLGSTFRITLPATRATFRGILVEVAERLFVVPTTQVERVIRTGPDDVQTVEGRETISFDGRTVALMHLADVLELAREQHAKPATGVPVIVIGSGDLSVAFVVDAILDEQEVLVKPLRKPLSRVRNIAAATVLGSGRVAPILNVADLLKSARKAVTPTRWIAEVAPVENAAQSILIAEDSITSRMLLKGILESAGYQVKTAVDGMEAFSMLRAEKFDLVVSDVEMPRLNGFDLTARIRADKKLAELPVVLVTALETPEDRERGIDAGADAYLVKSNFDQSNLLEALRRLI
ncbi:MAG TPA: hybrid sensor histidine kinase/response regulator [Methylophilaceae bacterium]|jgi:two-component system chemotaxis sensor kinase CheA